MDIENNVEKLIDDFKDELNHIESSFSKFIFKTQQNKTEEIRHQIKIAEWYVRGTIYHCKNLIKHYKKICENVEIRALGTMNASGQPPEVILMYSPEILFLYYEFYSLVNLARISLDNLRYILSPVFSTPFNQLPKSITRFLNGETNCPIYQDLKKADIVKYLIDIRDCLTHYRSFASSDNVMAVLEGSETPQIEWSLSLARLSYRFPDISKVVVNIYLPDAIFTYNHKSHVRGKMAIFTYTQKYNILSQSMQFVKFITSITSSSILLLEKEIRPIYTYEPR